MTFPAKPGMHKPDPHPAAMMRPSAPAPPVEDRFKTKPPAPDGKLTLDDDALRALGVQGVSARVLQAILSKPGITSEELLEEAEAHQTNLNPAVVLLMDKGYIEVKMARDPNKRGGMVKAHHATREGLRAAILDQVATLRSLADRLGGAS